MQDKEKLSKGESIKLKYIPENSVSETTQFQLLQNNLTQLRETLKIKEEELIEVSLANEKLREKNQHLLQKLLVFEEKGSDHEMTLAQAEIRKLKEEKETLFLKYKKVENVKSEVRKGIEILQGKIDASQLKISNQTQEIETLLIQKEQIKSEIKSLEQEQDNKKVQVTDLLMEAEELKKEIISRAKLQGEALLEEAKAQKEFLLSEAKAEKNQELEAMRLELEEVRGALDFTHNELSTYLVDKVEELMNQNNLLRK